MQQTPHIETHVKSDEDGEVVKRHTEVQLEAMHGGSNNSIPVIASLQVGRTQQTGQKATRTVIRCNLGKIGRDIHLPQPNDDEANPGICADPATHSYASVANKCRMQESHACLRKHLHEALANWIEEESKDPDRGLLWAHGWLYGQANFQVIWKSDPVVHQDQDDPDEVDTNNNDTEPSTEAAVAAPASTTEGKWRGKRQ